MVKYKHKNNRLTTVNEMNICPASGCEGRAPVYNYIQESR